VQKTMMEAPDFDFGDKLTVYRIYLAVQSPWAADAWDNSDCPGDPPTVLKSRSPTAVFELSYPPAKQ